MNVLFDTGETVEARIKGKKLKPVCGDRVRVESIDNESDGLITAIERRRNELTRPNMRGKIETLAANVDCLVVMAAVSPLPDWFIVDRYLCAAELMNANSVVVFNKVDLLRGENLEIPELAEYRAIGTQVFECSAEDGEGVVQLGNALHGQCAIVVGQSGVGKSSLINQLVSDSQQKTSHISRKTGEGRHTTVNSVMLPLKHGGSVIDSPGVRDYAPALSDASDAATGFREIARAAASCRFANCRHLREPGCAVKDAVEEESISERRYESYKRVVNLTEKINEARY